MIKLVALDMDGTLLNSQSTLPEKNKLALQRIIAQGVKVVLASGRPFQSLKKYCDLLSLNQEDDYTICFNGGEVIHNRTEKAVYFKGIDGKIVKEAWKLSLSLPTCFFAYNREEIILYDTYSDYMMFEKNLTGNPALQLDFNQIRDEDAYVKLTFTDAKETLDRVAKTIDEAFSSTHTVIRTHAYFIEIVNRETSKGAALKYLMDTLHLKPEEVMAFGDNDNDSSMLKEAGYRIAMKNSFSRELKKIATEIAPCNDDCGVAQILDRYIP